MQRKNNGNKMVCASTCECSGRATGKMEHMYPCMNHLEWTQKKNTHPYQVYGIADSSTTNLE